MAAMLSVDLLKSNGDARDEYSRLRGAYRRIAGREAHSRLQLHPGITDQHLNALLNEQVFLSELEA